MGLSEEDRKRIEEDEKYRDQVREKEKRKRLGRGCLVVILLFSLIFVLLVIIGLFAGEQEDGDAATAGAPGETRITTSTRPTPMSAPRIEIVDIQTRVTEKGGDVWWRFAYRLTLRNNTSTPRQVDATVEWQDADGFIIDSAREFDLVLQAHEERTFTGDELISLPGARNVAQVYATINR